MTKSTALQAGAPDDRVWEPIKVADMDDLELISFIRLMNEAAVHVRSFLDKIKPCHSASNPRPLPSQKDLRALFDYDARSGSLLWKKPPSKSSVKSGTAAGGIKSGGYISIKLNGLDYKAHRLVYVWHLGEIPSTAQIDHVDGNKANNRIENLRICSASENGRNRPAQANNTEGLKGAYLHENGRSWQSVIRFQRTNHFLGLYKTKEEAHRAYVTAARAIHGTFMHNSLQSVDPLPRDHKVWDKISKIPGAIVPPGVNSLQLSLSLGELRMDKKMPSEMITGHSFTTNPTTSELQTRPTCDSFRCHSTSKLNEASNERTT